MDYTSLGLGGVPRSGVLYDDLVQGTARPDSGQFTELGPSGSARAPQTFDAKGAGSIPPRPDGYYTELGLSGTPGVIRDFTAKTASRGIVGSVSLSVTMQSTMAIGRRYYTPTDIVLGVRPMGAVITVAHSNRVTGALSLAVRCQAGLRYTRFGTHNSMQGNQSVGVTPYGFTKYRAWRRITGTCPISVTPRATLTYTPAPVRHHQVQGSLRVRLIPASVVTHEAHGTAYSISGSSTIAVSMRGIVSVVRETTYAMSGRINYSVSMRGAITKATGLPVNYHISGSIVVTVTPNSRMGIVVGETEQHAIVGMANYGVRVASRVTVKRAPTITPLDGRAGRRGFIRIFR